MPDTKSLLATIDTLISDAERGVKIPTEVIDVLSDISLELKKSKESQKFKIDREENQVILDRFETLVEELKTNKEDFAEFKESIIAAIKEIQINNDVRVSVPDVVIPEIKVPEANIHIPPIEIPEVKVTIPPIVVPEAPAPIINNPDTVSIKKPTWLGQAFEPVVKAIGSLEKAVKAFKLPTNAKDAIAVKLSDGKEFYKALGGAVSSTVGNILTFATAAGEKKAALVDDDGRLQVQMASFPGFNIPTYDYILLTYVSSGNGDGEIKTVTYFEGGSSGTELGTITLTYNSDNEIATVAWAEA